MQNQQSVGGRMLTPDMAAAENARFMSAVYGWMTGGLAVTGAIAWYIAQDEQLAISIVTNRPLFWGLIIAQLGAVVALGALARRISGVTAAMIFFGYAALTGVTFSAIFLIYTASSVGYVFALTSFSFAGLSLVGATTKRDLGPVGAFCTMGLFGLIGFGLLSILFPSLMTDSASFVYGLVGVIVFAGLTAYDTQKIKAMNVLGNEGTDDDRKEAIFGALKLYLDFINLFLSILRLMGKRR